jgi:flavin-binding protein dodecin
VENAPVDGGCERKSNCRGECRRGWGCEANRKAETRRPGTWPRSLARKEGNVAESVYKVIELVGSSAESWEKAAANAVEKAAKSLRDLRIAEVIDMDMQIDDGKVVAYRTKVKVSFKYED